MAVATAVQPTKGVPVPYMAEISRTNPSCFIFLVDQSASMVDPIGGEVRVSKADVVADALNRLLTELSLSGARRKRECATTSMSPSSATGAIRAKCL